MKRHVIFFICIVMSASCTRVIEIDMENTQPLPVINALINPDSIWQISLTRSRNILEISYYAPIPNAEVTILDDNGVLIETLQYVSDQYFRYKYRGSSTPMENGLFRVSVKMEDGQVLSAKSQIPVPVPIESVEIDSSKFIINGDDIEMAVVFNDPPKEKNYYTIKILRSAYYLNNEDTIRFVEDVYYEPVNPKFEIDVSNGNGTLISDNLFNGDVYEFRLKIKPYYNMGTTENLKVGLLSVSEEYYKYFFSINLQSGNSEDPFAQPTQVFSNIENGIGIFAGYSSSYIQVK